MRVILIDDEEAMLVVLKEMLSRIPNIEVLAMFQNAREALIFLKENKTQIAFVDINMPGESGLDFARSLLFHNIDTAVVFTTAFKEHALEAFDVSAFDYLVKPISQSRLERTISKAVIKQTMEKPKNHATQIHNISVYCMGSLDVINKDSRKIKWISSKSEEVFFYLLLNHGKTVSRHILLEEIFSDMPLTNAKAYLNTAIYQLRKSLDSHGMKNAIISYNNGYALELKDAYVDFIELESRINQAKQIDASNIDYLIETEKIYTGDLFNDTTYIWALPTREKIFELYFNFAKRLVTWLLKSNNSYEASRIIKKLININELDEETNSLLLQTYAMQRDKSSFKKQYERYTNLLKKEIGDRPNRNIVNLYAELIRDFN